MSTPITFGSNEIGRQLKSGNCRALLFGDSILSNGGNRAMVAIPRCWTPDKLVGVGGHANGGSVTYNYSPNTGADAIWTKSDYDGSDSPAGAQGWAPYTAAGGTNLGAKITFNGGAAGSVKIMAYFTSASNFIADAGTYGYTWRNQVLWSNNKPLTFKWVDVCHPDGLSDYTAIIKDTWTTYATLANINASTVSGITYTVRSLSAAAADWSVAVNGAVGVKFYPTVGTTPANGKIFCFSGGTISTGESGLIVDNLACASSNTSDWASRTFYNAGMLAARLSMHANNVVVIMLGQNDGATTKAAYKASLASIITDCITADPSVQFVLISPYQTSPSSRAGWFSDAADACYELAQVYSSRMLFLNLWYAFGGKDGETNAWTFMDKNILIDGVHPNAQGNYAIFMWIWQMIEHSAALAATRHIRRPGVRQF